jgi:hypothetical protein
MSKMTCEMAALGAAAIPSPAPADAIATLWERGRDLCGCFRGNLVHLLIGVRVSNLQPTAQLARFIWASCRGQQIRGPG